MIWRGCPAAILGHNFAGAAMPMHIPYAAVLFIAGEAACAIIGALIGVGVVVMRMRGERR